MANKKKDLGLGEEVVGTPVAGVETPVEAVTPEETVVPEAVIQPESTSQVSIDSSGDEWIVTPDGIRFRL